jgi:hypothetical protein
MPRQDDFERGEVPIAFSGWTIPQGTSPKWPALDGDAETSVVVIGAGLAGSSLALHLAEAGVAVAVLEARQPGWGASGRNAGHVLPILRDLKALEHFPDGGRRFLDLFRQHLTIPYDLSVKHGIDCDAVRSGYVNGMRSKGAQAAFLRQHAYLERVGIQRLVPLSPEDMQHRLGTGAYPHGVLFEDGGRVNPYLFTNGMIAAAVRFGARVHGDSEALALERMGARWRVRTSRGTVVADRVVFCTNAYPGRIEPAFPTAFYPLTAYAITTRPLPAEALDHILPGGGTFAQAPIDLNPMVRDRHNRLILSSIPRVGRARDADWHFRSQLRWLHRTWPATRSMAIERESYWTGRVALRDRQFPGVFRLDCGVYGLMYFNAWGNIMAPLMGKLLASGLASDNPAGLPFPMETVEPVSMPRKQELLIRHLLLPAARTAQRLGMI